MSAVKLKPVGQGEIEFLKELFNFVDLTGECFCDRGCDFEPSSVCAKHQTMGKIQGRIFNLGGGIYGE